jgi:hypothetical protein
VDRSQRAIWVASVRMRGRGIFRNRYPIPIVAVTFLSGASIADTARSTGYEDGPVLHFHWRLRASWMNVASP